MTLYTLRPVSFVDSWSLWTLTVYKTYSQHNPVLNIQEDLLLLAVVTDQRVKRVAMWHPANQPRVGGEGNHRESLDSTNGYNQCQWQGTDNDTVNKQNTVSATGRILSAYSALGQVSTVTVLCKSTAYFVQHFNSSIKPTGFRSFALSDSFCRSIQQTCTAMTCTVLSLILHSILFIFVSSSLFYLS